MSEVNQASPRKVLKTWALIKVDTIEQKPPRQRTFRSGYKTYKPKWRHNHRQLVSADGDSNLFSTRFYVSYHYNEKPSGYITAIRNDAPVGPIAADCGPADRRADLLNCLLVRLYTDPTSSELQRSPTTLSRIKHEQPRRNPKKHWYSVQTRDVGPHPGGMPGPSFVYDNQIWVWQQSHPDGPERQWGAAWTDDYKLIQYEKPEICAVYLASTNKGDPEGTVADSADYPQKRRVEARVKILAPMTEMLELTSLAVILGHMRQLEYKRYLAQQAASSARSSAAIMAMSTSSMAATSTGIGCSGGGGTCGC